PLCKGRFVVRQRMGLLQQVGRPGPACGFGRQCLKPRSILLQIRAGVSRMAGARFVFGSIAGSPRQPVPGPSLAYLVSGCGGAGSAGPAVFSFSSNTSTAFFNCGSVPAGRLLGSSFTSISG